MAILLCSVVALGVIAAPTTAHAQSTCNDGAFYVGPCNGAVSVSAGSTGTIYFGVQNDLSYPMDVTLTPSCTGAVSRCYLSSRADYVTIDGYAGIDVYVNYELAPGATSGTISLSANNSATATQTVNVTGPPGIAPADGRTVYDEQDVTHARNFVITNPNYVDETYDLLATCPPAQSCSVASTVFVLANSSANVPVTYYTGLVGTTADIQLNASSADGSATATMTVVPLSASVTVAPRIVSPTAPNPNDYGTVQFDVAAVGTATPVTYNLNPVCTGSIINCTVQPDVKVYKGSPQSVTVSFQAAPDSAGGPGSVALHAQASGTVHPYEDQESIYVGVHDLRTYMPMFTPPSDTAYNEANVSTNYVFRLKNVGNTNAQYTLQIISCTGVGSGMCTVRRNPVPVNAGETADVPVDYHTGAAGQVVHMELFASTTVNGSLYADRGNVLVVPLAPTVRVTAPTRAVFLSV